MGLTRLDMEETVALAVFFKGQITPADIVSKYLTNTFEDQVAKHVKGLGMEEKFLHQNGQKFFDEIMANDATENQDRLNSLLLQYRKKEEPDVWPTPTPKPARKKPTIKTNPSPWIVPHAPKTKKAKKGKPMAVELIKIAAGKVTAAATAATTSTRTVAAADTVSLPGSANLTKKKGHKKTPRRKLLQHPRTTGGMPVSSVVTGSGGPAGAYSLPTLLDTAGSRPRSGNFPSGKISKKRKAHAEEQADGDEIEQLP